MFPPPGGRNNPTLYLFTMPFSAIVLSNYYFSWLSPAFLALLCSGSPDLLWLLRLAMALPTYYGSLNLLLLSRLTTAFLAFLTSLAADCFFHCRLPPPLPTAFRVFSPLRPATLLVCFLLLYLAYDCKKMLQSDFNIIYRYPKTLPTFFSYCYPFSLIPLIMPTLYCRPALSLCMCCKSSAMSPSNCSATPAQTLPPSHSTTLLNHHCCTRLETQLP
jgi:hypothetical protein